MTGRVGSPLGVCVLPEPGSNQARTSSYPSYAGEILGHAGLCYALFGIAELQEALRSLRVLVTVGDAELAQEDVAAIERWVAAGGAWLAVAGTLGAGRLLGVEEEAPAHRGWGSGKCTLGEGYLEAAEQGHSLTASLVGPMHFYSGLAVRAAGGVQIARVLDAHQRGTERAAMVEAQHGAGMCLFVAPDLTGSIVRIQQGIAVTCDGVPSPDGTAPICDALLKSEDGGVLDWLLDREPVEGAGGLSVFTRAIADEWRDLLLGAIAYLARSQGVAIPLLWYHPRDLPAVGHLSHDSDGNDPTLAERLLGVLESIGVRSTWCILAPGYEPTVLDEIRSKGHELALHYDAVETRLPWSEAEFIRQLRSVSAAAGQWITANKNHYLRWEGDTELWEWCERHGVWLDQSKGGSKTGAAGFTFGSCHVYRPMTRHGRLMSVFELATQTQDLVVFAPEALLPHLLRTVLRHHGVLHLLFHPAHIARPGVAEALAASVRAGREAGLEWWTGRELVAWERARRSAQWVSYEASATGTRAVLRAGAALGDATVRWLGAGPTDAVVATVEEGAEAVYEA